MSDGKGKIVDGMSYQSTLPEAYAKVKHERDNVVEAFNKLKERQRELDDIHLELRLAAEGVIYALETSNKRKIEQALQTLEETL